MTIEAGIVIGLDGEQVLYRHLPPNRNVGSLPDSDKLWNIFLTNWNLMAGFAHSHPGHGIPGPSWEDITTFCAVEQGLGRRYRWWITSMDHLALVEWEGPGNYDYKTTPMAGNDPSWVQELRRLSKEEVVAVAEM